MCGSWREVGKKAWAGVVHLLRAWLEGGILEVLRGFSLGEKNYFLLQVRARCLRGLPHHGLGAVAVPPQ